MERWQGRTAVVTGASAGIGAAIAVELANAGLKVIGLARRAKLIDKLKSQVTGGGSIESRQCDVSNAKEVEVTFKWVEDNRGGVDILVNNAAVMFQGHITDVGPYTLTEEQIISVIDTNIKGLVLCTRHAVASMKRRGYDGHIININSIAGHYVPFNSIMNVYTASKYAVTAFTGALNTELADFKNKIKTTSISPGLVDTAMARGNLPEAQKIVEDSPKLQPKDVADAVLYVVSTPPAINIEELRITSVTEKKL